MFTYRGINAAKMIRKLQVKGYRLRDHASLQAMDIYEKLSETNSSMIEKSETITCISLTSKIL